MSRPSIKEPVVICSKAAQRLAAIYRQHRPDQPALAVLPQHGKAVAEDQGDPAEQPSSVRTAVLDAPLPYTSTSPQPKITDWQNLRDTHSELYVTCHTLRRLQLLHGTLVEVIPLQSTSYAPHMRPTCHGITSRVQVFASQDSSETAHLARILAIDAEQHTAILPHVHQQSLSSSYMTPPANVSQQPAQQQGQQQPKQQEPQSHFVAQCAWEHDVAYLAPALAFNLGLQHELWPLMPQVSPDADRRSLTQAVQGTAHQNHKGQSSLQQQSMSIQVLIRPLRQFAMKRVVDVPQSGM